MKVSLPGVRSRDIHWSFVKATSVSYVDENEVGDSFSAESRNSRYFSASADKFGSEGSILVYVYAMFLVRRINEIEMRRVTAKAGLLKFVCAIRLYNEK